MQRRVAQRGTTGQGAELTFDCFSFSSEKERRHNFKIDTASSILICLDRLFAFKVKRVTCNGVTGVDISNKLSVFLLISFPVALRLD